MSLDTGDNVTMKYDDEYNSFRFTPKDMEIILEALSYVHQHDRSLSQSDRDYLDGIYQSLENARVTYAS